MTNSHLQTLTILALAAVLPALAQTTTTTGTPVTCTTPPTSITALTLERTVALSSISSSATASIPATFLSGLASGAIEIRQQFSYNPTTSFITITDFAAQPGSASPTAANTIFSGNVLSSESFAVDKIYASCKPVPSLLITGTIATNYPVSPLGDVTGVPVALSLAYTMDTPAKITNVVISYAGIGSIYSATAAGTLTVPTTTVTTPTTGNAPVIVVAGGLHQSTAQRQFGLDVSGSTSPLKLALTYTVIQVAPPAAGSTSTTGPTTGIPQAAGISASGPNGVFLITFASGKGPYAFQITATDSQGNSATQVVVIDHTAN